MPPGFAFTPFERSEREKEKQRDGGVSSLMSDIFGEVVKKCIILKRKEKEAKTVYQFC